MTKTTNRAAARAKGASARGRAAPKVGRDARRDLQANVDRLMAAIARRTGAVRRADAIEILAEALGHRNSNETTRAVAEGALAPATLTPVGRLPLPDGGEILVGVDAEGRVLGVSPDLAANERYAPSPYRGLVDLAGLRDAPPLGGACVTHVVTVEHADGDLRLSGATADEAFSRLARWCRETWAAVVREGEPPAGDKAVVERFFEGNATHSYTVGEVEVARIATRDAPPPLARPTRTLVRTALRRDGEVLFNASGVGREEALAAWCRNRPGGGVLPADPGACLAAFLAGNPDVEATTTEREVPIQLEVGMPGTMAVHTATVTHRHGVNFYVADCEADLDRQLAEYARESWDELEGVDNVDVDDLGDAEVVETYFEGVAGDEQLDRGREAVWVGRGDGRPTPPPKAPPAGPRELHVRTLRHEDGDERDFQGFDAASARRAMAAWCRENWSEGRGWASEPPRDDDEAVRAFVGDGGRHTWTEKAFDLVGGGADEPAAGGVDLDDVEWDLVLAALRMVQRRGLDAEEVDVAEGGVRDGIPDDDEIDDICERIVWRGGSRGDAPMER